MERDGACQSIWQDTESVSVSGSVPGQVYDVIIVGGGITGISTALELQRSGMNCLVAEAYNLGFGTTGGTTAHLNNFLDAPYHQVQQDFGKDNAALLADAAKEAIAFVKNNVLQYGLQCGFADRTAYIFSVEPEQDSALDKIVEASNEVGVEMGYINDSPFPIPYRKIVSVPGNAQFHPLEYINGLAKKFLELGGQILENCAVKDVTGGEELTVTTSLGEFQARKLVYATHIPPGVNILHFRCAPYRSYAMAFKLTDGSYPQALGYDLCEPYHYYRSQEIDGSTYLIAGGEDHKTGDEENTEQCFRKLEAYVNKYYPVESVAYKWSSQFFEPADGLAYIGHLPGNGENIYTATGFGGNGMIYGSLSAIILTDLIVNGDSRYKQLFNPSRVKPIAGFNNFVKESADVIGHFIGDRFNIKTLQGISEISAGEAKLCKHDGHTIGVYKDDRHQVFAINAACSHVKCIIHWNNAEKTWDCPCHGSRFSYLGKVLTGPARKDLEQFDLGEEKD